MGIFFREQKKYDDSLPEDTVLAFKASDGDVYVGTTSGLSIIDGKTGEITNVNKTSGIQNDYIMCLTETLDGSIWVGTDGGGVFVLKK